ncbi:MAG TPA: N-6 DNA methylase [Pirellulales bacterium]|nr:N-6 DNA methylase [Pirellulales bacterium]
MPAPPIIRELVERFERHYDSYQSAGYNEAQLRREFLDPLFKAMGWDIDNEQGLAEAYKDVIHEDAIKVGGETKAPDTCFRIGGRRIFFLEAKKPAVKIREDPVPAFQLRRYAWSAKLPLSILSNFEWLAAYDCRVKPHKNDKPSVARVLLLNYKEYLDRWDELAGIFSREAVLKGSFDKFAESTKLKRGTGEVDDAFLKEIESWRDLLARNFALRNPGLSQRDLNFAVQRTIDRIIFLRMCEDRGIESYGQLSSLLAGDAPYRRLCELYDRADERYNSGLFHFRAEKGRAESPDELTQSLILDEKPLREIVRELYYPDSAYEFSVLPAEILGQVYEQFLGKVIRLTAGHRAVVEDKPEVKKAGGVYYTPAYIVDYIVRQTVGKLVENRAPKDVARLHVVDPACGSGSFLVGAFQFLLDWHRDRYVADGVKAHSKEIYQGPGGQWHLTTAEKKRILLNNIYGVDIDSQAVEVTKLSLLLKVLEHENRETLERQLRLLHERALPDLGNNIKCGNSLIGPNFYNGQQMSLLDDEERYRVNVFDWKAEFPGVFKGKAGGFDVVIGNPPYIRIQALTEWNPIEVEHYKRAFLAAGKGNYDLYVVFVERGFSMLRAEGHLGFIVPSKFLTTDYGEPLRRLIADAKALTHMVDFGHELVFQGVSTYTVLLFLSRRENESASVLATRPAQLGVAGASVEATHEIEASRIGAAPWSFQGAGGDALIAKLIAQGTPLLALPAKMSRGSSTGADDVFMLCAGGRGFRDRDGNSVVIEKSILRTPLYATDFNRYSFKPAAEERVIFPYSVQDESYELFSESRLKSEFPNAHKYLRSKRTALVERKQYNEWFGFSASRNLNVHDRATLVVPLLANRGTVARLPKDPRAYCLMASGGFSISLQDTPDAQDDYVLGLLNSKLLFWYLKRISNKFRGGWITCTKQYFGRLPIRRLAAPDKGQRDRRDEIAGLVRRMTELNSEAPGAKAPDVLTRIEREIDSTDRRIDQLVYELYRLTDEEITLVEASDA